MGTAPASTGLIGVCTIHSTRHLASRAFIAICIFGPNMGQIEPARLKTSVRVSGWRIRWHGSETEIHLAGNGYLRIAGCQSGGHEFKVYVLSGKTLNIRTELKP